MVKRERKIMEVSNVVCLFCYKWNVSYVISVVVSNVVKIVLVCMLKLVVLKSY